MSPAEDSDAGSRWLRSEQGPEGGVRPASQLCAQLSKTMQSFKKVTFESEPEGGGPGSGLSSQVMLKCPPPRAGAPSHNLALWGEIGVPKSALLKLEGGQNLRRPCSDSDSRPSAPRERSQQVWVGLETVHF